MVKLAAAAVALLWAQDQPAQDRPQVANLEYKSWADFRPGSFVRVHHVIEDDAGRTEMEIRHKLLQVTARRAVVETRSVLLSGAERDVQVGLRKREIPARVDAAEQATAEEDEEPPDPNDEERMARIRERNEEIDVGETKLLCRTIERVLEEGPLRLTTKLWYSREVPGGLVKLETSARGGAKYHTCLTVVEFNRE